MDPAGSSTPTTTSPGVALCLAGGGFSGALFELGAVAALQAGLSGWHLSQSTVIVGTSSGAVVGAYVAMGGDPRAMLDAKSPRDAITPRDLSRFPWGRHARGWARAIAVAPVAIRRRFRGGRVAWGEVLDDLAAEIPAGVFTNDGIGRLISRMARNLNTTDSFEDLSVPLVVTTTDLDSGERVVYGTGYDTGPKISTAVCASSAVPAYFEPVRIGERDHIDGQIIDPLHLDLTAVPGTTAVLAVTPLIPYRKSARANGDRIRSMGPGAVYDQSARISAMVKHRWAQDHFEARHPEVRCHLIQPDPGDVLELLHTGARLEAAPEIWRLGFRVAATRLLTERQAYENSLGRLSISVDEDKLRSAAETGKVVLPA